MLPSVCVWRARTRLPRTRDLCAHKSALFNRGKYLFIGLCVFIRRRAKHLFARSEMGSVVGYLGPPPGRLGWRAKEGRGSIPGPPRLLFASGRGSDST